MPSRPFLYSAVNFLPFFRAHPTVPLHSCKLSAASSNSALSVCAFCSHFLLSPSVRTHVNFLPFFGSFSTFPLHSCAVFAAFSRVSDFFFTPLHSFCRFIALIRPKLYTAAQFLPPFGAHTTVSLHGCTVSAATYRSALSVRTFCPRPCKVFAAFWRVPDFSFTQLRSFCRFFARIRPFLYSAVNFLPHFRAYPTFPLHACKVSAVFWRVSDRNFTSL